MHPKLPTLNQRSKCRVCKVKTHIHIGKLVQCSSLELGLSGRVRGSKRECAIETLTGGSWEIA